MDGNPEFSFLGVMNDPRSGGPAAPKSRESTTGERLRQALPSIQEDKK